jgi:hypothetical protein
MKQLFAILLLGLGAQCSMPEEMQQSNFPERSDWVGSYSWGADMTPQYLDLLDDGIYKVEQHVCVGGPLQEWGKWEMSPDGIVFFPTRSEYGRHMSLGEYRRILFEDVHFLLSPRLQFSQVEGEDLYYSAYVKDSDASPRGLRDLLGINENTGSVAPVKDVSE